MMYKHPTDDEMWTEEVQDEDWPPREIHLSEDDKRMKFIQRVLSDLPEGTSSFKCPNCGGTAVRKLEREFFAAKCEGCGITLMS